MAEATIDTLRIQIEAEAERAAGTLESFTSKLKSVQNALAGVDIGKMQSLSDTLKGMSNIKLGATTNEVKNLNAKLSDISSKTAKQMASSLMESFGVIDRDTQEYVKSATKELVNLDKQQKVFGDDSRDTADKFESKWTDIASEVGRHWTEAVSTMDDELREFYEYWKNTKLYISPELRADIGKDTWNDYLQNYIGHFTTQKGKGIAPDEIQEEMAEMFPSIFGNQSEFMTFGGLSQSGDSTVLATQIEQMIDAVERYKNSLEEVPHSEEEIKNAMVEALSQIDEQLTAYEEKLREVFGVQLNDEIPEAYAQATDKAGVSALSEAADGLSALKSAMKDLGDSSDKAQDVASMLKDIGSASENLVNFANAIKGLDFAPINDLQQYISKLAYNMDKLPKASTFTAWAKGLEKLSNAVSGGNLVVHLDGIEQSSEGIGEIVQKVTEMQSAESAAAEGTDALAESLSAIPTEGMESMVQAAESLNAKFDETEESVTGVESVTSRLGGTAATLNKDFDNAFGDLQRQAEELGVDVKTLEEYMNGLSEQDLSRMGGYFDSFDNGAAGAIPIVTSLESKLADFAAIVDAIGSAVANAFPTMLNFLKTGAGYALKLGANAAKAAANLAKVGLQNSNIGKMASSLANASKTLEGLNKKVERFTRLFTMMAVRKLYTQVFKEMGTAVQHLALQSDDFNQKLSELQSSLNYLGHTIVAAAEPLLNIFGTALTTIIDYLSEAITKVNQFLAAISGKTYYTKAKKVATDYAESLEESSKAAQNSLQGFNELNNMTTSNSGSGSSGSDELEDCYEQLEVEQDILDFVQRIKDAWAEADLTGIGEELGLALEGALDSIDWDSISSKAQGVATRIATLINGFVETEGLGTTIGTTIGNALNTGVSTADTFVTDLHWDSLGYTMASAINGALDTIDWQGIGALIKDYLNGSFEYAMELAANIKWDKLGSSLATAINTALSGIDWEAAITASSNIGHGIAESINNFFTPETLGNVGTTIGNVLNTVISGIKSFGTTIDWSNLGEAVGTGINDAIATLDVDKLAETINTYVKGALKAMAKLLTTTDFEEIGNKIGEFLSNIDLGEYLQDIAEVIWDAIKAAFDLLKGIFEEAPLETALIAAFSICTFTGVGKVIGGKIASAIVSGIVTAIGAEDLGTTVETALGVSTAGTTTSGTGAAVLGASLASIGTAVATIAAAALATWIVTNVVTDIVSEVQAALSGDDLSYTNAFGNSNFPNMNEETYDNLTKDADEVISELKEHRKDVQDNMENITDGLTDGTAKLTNKLSNVYSAIKDVPLDIMSMADYVDYAQSLTSFMDYLSNATPNSASGEDTIFNNSNLNSAVKSALGLSTTVETSVVKSAYWDDEAASVLESKDKTSTVTAKSVNGSSSTTALLKGSWDSITTKTSTLTGKSVDGSSGTLDKLTAGWATVGTKTSTLTGKAVNSNSGTLSTLTSSWNTVTTKTATLTGKSVNSNSGTLNTLTSGWMTVGTKSSTLTGKSKNSNSGTLDKLTAGWASVSTKTSTLTGKAKNSNSTTLSILSTDFSTTNSKTATLTGKAVNSNSSTLNTITTDFSTTNSKTATLTGKAVNSNSSTLNTITTDFSQTNSKTATLTGKAVNGSSSTFNTLTTDWTTISPKTAKLTATAEKKNASVFDSLMNIWNTIVSKVATLTGTATSTSKATGGILRNGIWTDIPQYASGTLRTGSVFVAGEAGAEVVGHINGTTEVLNQSQMAAVMASAVITGISVLIAPLQAIYSHMSECTNAEIEIVDTSATYLGNVITSANNSMNGNNASARGQEYESMIENAVERGVENAVGAYIKRIADNSDDNVTVVQLDGKPIFKTVKKQAQEYYRKTGEYAFA